MIQRPEAPASQDLSVLDAWRQLGRPPARRAAPGYVGIMAVIVLLNLSAMSAIAAAALPEPLPKMLAALLHVAVVPGALLAFILVPTDEVDLVEWLTLAFGLGLLVLVVGGVVLSLLPGPTGPIAVVLWTALLSLGLATFAFQRSNTWRPPRLGSPWATRGALLVLLAAAAARLPGLGYSELQGDETEMVLRATGVIQGFSDALFYHGKGPGEIVVLALPYGLAQILSEDAARLPYALAGIVGALAFSLVARRLLGEAGGVAAGLLIAVNGYFVAFSRITQYQSLVLLLGMLALLCAVLWSRGGSRVWPLLAGALAGAGVLAHYDALFVLPAIAVVVLWRTGWRGLLDIDALRPWLYGAAAGLAVLAVFFVPYVDSPLFSLVTDRVNDRVGAGAIRNNLGSIVASATLYLGTAFPLLVAALALLGLSGLIARPSGTPPARVWLLGLVWALLPLAVSAFVARKPGTHVHVATSGMMLLAAAGFATAWAALASRRAVTLGTGEALTGLLPRFLLLGGLLGGVALVGAYLVPVYLRTAAEVVRENRVESLPLAWRPPGGLPTKERFGFPYQAGWKAVGALYANGTLRGTYDSNEQPQVTYWYTRGVWRCSATPRYYLIAENVQDELDTPERVINNEYHPIGRITVAGEPKLRVFERGRAQPGARQTTWAAEDLTAAFVQQASRPTFDPGEWARGVVSREGTPLTVRYGDEIDLLGYQVLAEDPRPGGVVRVDLFWLPHVSARETHRIDVQLGSEPRIGDGSGPACDSSGDDRDWRAGRPFTQRISIPIAAGAAAGSYPLLVSVSRTEQGGGALTPTGELSTRGPLVEIGQVEIGAGSGGR
ncbi:MAG: glycosyltransferase family 39 protein [Chloroflexi bacterium]|nr:glycosyltransferase family 39 protein [Chloroflexota bacterium]